jgi:1,4-dihydroxy-2-naphthoate octaprenyltransferase
MTNSIYALTAIIFLLGWYLVLHGGVPILIIGLLSVLGAYCYTAGPYPLAYNGLGEVFVFIFFGPVAVCGTEYMLTGTFTELGLMFGSILGGIASALLIVNNTRDIEEDRGTGKRTLVSLYGRNFANFLFGTSLLLPILVTALLQGESFPLVSFLALTYLYFLKLLNKFRKLKEGPEFNLMLGTIGKVLFIFSILASIVITLFLG